MEAGKHGGMEVGKRVSAISNIFHRNSRIFVIYIRSFQKMNKLFITAVFVEVPEGGYAAYVEEIPGVNTQGDTLDEAKSNLKEALTMVLETNKILAQRDYKQGVKSIREPLALI